MKSYSLPLIFFTILAFFLPVSITVSQIVSAGFLFFTAFKILKREEIDFSCFPHPTLLILFMLFPILSFFNAENMLKAITWYKRHLYIVVLPVFTAHLLQLKDKKDTILKAFLYGATASSIIAILQPFWGLNFDKPFNIQTYYVFATGFLSHPLTYSETTSFAIILSLYLFFKTTNQKQRILFILLLFVNFLGLIFSREKMPFAATITIAMIYSVVYLKKMGNLRNAILVMLILIIIPAIIPDKKKILWRFQREKIAFSIKTRAKIWERGIEDFKSHPITGIGFGNYSIRVEKWNKKGFNTLSHAHSNIFELLATTGITGFVIFFLFHITILKDFMLSLKNERDYLFYLALLSIFLLYHIEGLTECTFKDTELNLQLFLFLSIFYSSLCSLVKDKNKASENHKPS